MTEPTPLPEFKKSTMEETEAGSKNRLWKSLKQILAYERTLEWPEEMVACKYTMCTTHVIIIKQI